METVSANDVNQACLAPDQGQNEAAMLCTLGAILRRGSFGNEELDTLLAMANDTSAHPMARAFARQAVDWLAQQFAWRVASKAWQIRADAFHL